MRKKFLSLALALTLVCQVPAVSVYADTGDEQQAATEDASVQAAAIMKEVEDLLSEPMTREKFAKVLEDFDGASDEVRSLYDLEKTNYFNQLKDLMEYADRASAAMDEIHMLGLTATRDDYDVFVQEYTDAQDVVKLYEGKFSNCKSKDVFSNCLPTIVKKTLVPNYPKYEKAGAYYAVEEAYLAIGDFDVLTEEVAARVKTLSKAVQKAEEDYEISIYDFFNSAAIKTLLERTEKVSSFEEEMDLLPETITSTQDLAALMRAYEKFGKMSESEQNMVPASYADRLQNAVKVTTDCQSVIDQIQAVGVLQGEEDYSDFSKRYEDAYKAYQFFVNKYQDISGVADLITNQDILDQESSVLEMVKSFRKIMDQDAAMMCSFLIQMNAARTAYNAMDDSLKEQVYNYEDFVKICEDTTQANEVRTMIDGIRSGFTAEDEAYIQKVRLAYENLSDKAKTYVGNSKYVTLQMAEEQLAALNANEAAGVTDKIAKLGTITVNSYDQIQAARRSYDALSSSQKLLVNNYQILTQAENTYKSLETSVAKASVTGLSSYVYSGQAYKPALQVVLNKVRLQEGIDYKLTFSGNKNAGKAMVKIQGIGNYKGSLTKQFVIYSHSIDAASLSGLKKSYAYQAGGVKPAVKLILNSTVLKKGSDYTISYKSNKKPGKAQVVITAKGNYAGVMKLNFKITKRSLKKASIKGVKKSYAYTGKRIRPSVKVKIGGRTLRNKKDYTIRYSNNTAKGKAVLLIRGKGYYKGTKKLRFKIA